MMFVLLFNPSINMVLGAEPQDLYQTDFDYYLGPGDQLDIKVWRHPDLDMKVTVRPDCGISYPIIQEIPVCDLSIIELRHKMTEGIQSIIKDPNLTINVVGFQSQKIFVLGEVVRPGLYPFEGRVSVLDAISRAGGYDRLTSALKSVVIIRKTSGRQAKAIKVNLWAVIKDSNIKDNINLKAGDIVFVPKSFIAKVDTFIDHFLSKTDPALQYYLDVLDITQRTPVTRTR